MIKVGNIDIKNGRAFVIADIGSNHLQDLTIAKESIDAAIESGADAVKFQSINLNELYLKPDLKTSNFIRKLEFPENWHKILNDYCIKKGIIFFSSPTYLKAVDILEDINVPIYKLASAQVGTFPQIVEKVAKLNKPTIFSSGISNYEEITKAVSIFEKHGNKKYMILHCNSIYPTPPEKVNLKLMDTYKSMFGCPVGFSDHSIGINTSLAAVAIGAQIIEKHFTLDRKFSSPDSTQFASDPLEMKNLIDNIRNIEKSINIQNSRFKIQNEELEFKNSIKYRVILKRNINKGEIVSKSDINFKRFPNGIDCREVFDMTNLGKANKDLKKGNILMMNNLNKIL